VRAIITATWDDNTPHLTAAVRQSYYDSIPAYQRDARTRGVPQLGAGVIYPVAEDDIVVDPFKIPDHWPRGYGFDVGWNRTAAIWDALDPDTGIAYRYDEHYSGQGEPEVHAAAIRRRGLWIPGRIDPAARGRNQKDGTRLLTIYRRLIYGDEDLSVGAQLLGLANNSVESGIYQELMAQQQGFLKVFRNRCPNWLAERRLYRRDEKGRIIKKNDHAMDAGRYRTASGTGWLRAKPAPTRPVDPTERMTRGSGGDALSWMGSM
jgi:hypothetical protein